MEPSIQPVPYSFHDRFMHVITDGHWGSERSYTLPLMLIKIIDVYKSGAAFYSSFLCLLIKLKVLIRIFPDKVTSNLPPPTPHPLQPLSPSPTNHLFIIFTELWHTNIVGLLIALPKKILFIFLNAFKENASVNSN